MIAICEICKKEYYIRPSHFKRVKHHFCSRKCRGVSHRGKGNPQWKDNLRECKNCKKLFKPKDKNSFFCSRKCWAKNYSERKGTIIGKCLYCGKNRKIEIHEKDKKCFCSRKCADNFHSMRMIKEGNPNW